MRVRIVDIMYFEKEKRKLALHMKNGDKIIIGKSISEMQKVINRKNFITIHRSCVVNVDYINRITDSTITLTNDVKMSMSRLRIKEIRSKIFEIWMENPSI